MTYSCETDSGDLCFREDSAVGIISCLNSEYHGLQSRFYPEQIRVDPRKRQILSLLGFDQRAEGGIRKNSFISEGLELPSTQRLFRLAQINPALNNLLGIELTRGQHTLDCMEATAVIFTDFALKQPEQFDRLTCNYPVCLRRDELPQMTDRKMARRVKTIMHFVEYMRRHDEKTLPFQGTTHSLFRYDEDEALLEELSLFPVPADAVNYYNKYSLDPYLIAQIAHEAIRGSHSLAQVLKGKGEKGHCLSIDTLAYSLRDGITISNRLPGVETGSDSFEDLLYGFARLSDLNQALKNGEPFILCSAGPTDFHIANLIPDNLLSFTDDEKPQVVYNDPLFIYQVYATHVLLRLFASGAPWVRGTNRLLTQEFLGQIKPQTETAASLSFANEEAPPRHWLRFLRESALETPFLLPPEIKGWAFVPTMEDNHSLYIFKQVDRSLIQTETGVTTFNNLFPKISSLVDKLSQKTNLQLKQLNC